MLSYILAPSKNSVKGNVVFSVIFLEVSAFIEERREVKELTQGHSRGKCPAGISSQETWLQSPVWPLPPNVPSQTD